MLKYALLILHLSALPLRAQTVDTPPPDDPVVSASQQMYRNALQSIAEGRNNDASETLTQVVEKEPLHAGAWLDLALIQCELGHSDEAERLFATIETRFNPPPGIVDLISEARDRGCLHWQPHSQMSLTLGRGIDQNVNQGASSSTYSINQDGISVELPLLSDFLPKHDQFSLVSADYLRDLSPNGSIGYIQFQSRRNDTINQYNSSSLFLGVETPWRFDRWTLRGSGMIGLVTLGGQLYQRQAQVQARVSPPLPLPDKVQFNLVTALTHLQYTTLDNFDSNTLEVGGQFTYHTDGSYLSANLSFLDDRAVGSRPGSNRHGTLSGLLLRHDLGKTVVGEIGFNRQTWYSATAYSPGLIDEIRHQDTRSWHANIVYPLSRSQSLKLEVRQIRNDENISLFQYNDRQLQLNWQWQGL